MAVERSWQAVLWDCCSNRFDQRVSSVQRTGDVSNANLGSLDYENFLYRAFSPDAWYIKDFNDAEFTIRPFGYEVWHGKNLSFEGVGSGCAAVAMLGSHFQQANSPWFEGRHPCLEAFLRIVCMIERIRIDEIGFPDPLCFHVMKIHLNCVGEIICSRRYLRADDFTAQEFTKPELLQSSSRAMANAERDSVKILLQIISQERDIIPRYPNLIYFCLICGNLRSLVSGIIEIAVAVFVTVQYITERLLLRSSHRSLS